jgi:hypothetical protein
MGGGISDKQENCKYAKKPTTQTTTQTQKKIAAR